MAAISVCEMSGRAHKSSLILSHFFHENKIWRKQKAKKNRREKIIIFCDHINGQVLSLFFLYFGALNHNKSGEILIQMYTAVNYVMSEL